MKIYQLHKYGGEEMYLNEYDDVDDVYVVGNIYDAPTIGVEDEE